MVYSFSNVLRCSRMESPGESLRKTASASFASRSFPRQAWIPASEQLNEGDARIVLTMSDDFYLCTRTAATPDMDINKAPLLMHERTVKYLFVPIIRRDTPPSS